MSRTGIFRDTPLYLKTDSGNLLWNTNFNQNHGNIPEPLKFRKVEYASGIQRSLPSTGNVLPYNDNCLFNIGVYDQFNQRHLDIGGVTTIAHDGSDPSITSNYVFFAEPVDETQIDNAIQFDQLVYLVHKTSSGQRKYLGLSACSYIPYTTQCSQYFTPYSETHPACDGHEFRRRSLSSLPLPLPISPSSSKENNSNISHIMTRNHLGSSCICRSLWSSYATRLCIKSIIPPSPPPSPPSPSPPPDWNVYQTSILNANGAWGLSISPDKKVISFGIGNHISVHISSEQAFNDSNEHDVFVTQTCPSPPGTATCELNMRVDNLPAVQSSPYSVPSSTTTVNNADVGASTCVKHVHMSDPI